METIHPLAKILVDSFNEAGINTDDLSFYDMMGIIWASKYDKEEREAYDLVLKALTKDVVAAIKTKEMIP